MSADDCPRCKDNPVQKKMLQKLSDSEFERLKKSSRLPECTSCKREFKPRSLYQLYCSDKCAEVKKEVLENLNKEMYEGKCTKCNLTFRKPKSRTAKRTCESCTRAIAREASKEYIKTHPKNVKKTDKRKTQVPYEELNRRSEYKRVFDDSGWTHYLKGRQWDRI